MGSKRREDNGLFSVSHVVESRGAGLYSQPALFLGCIVPGKVAQETRLQVVAGAADLGIATATAVNQRTTNQDKLKAHLFFCKGTELWILEFLLYG